jgi:hypothetical protein
MLPGPDREFGYSEVQAEQRFITIIAIQFVTCG